MKLHHLRLRGIGPFGGEADIDLASLGASGMFLLEGPTGSGKSTILDAIVFALYGKVAGSASHDDRIRSQFAPVMEPSVVDLVFETGAGIFRIRREPAFDRPSRRRSADGTVKTTRQQAKALLWRVTSPEAIPLAIADAAGEGGGIEPIATRLDEVGREIQRAIGLSREQFTQTVLLPQNEFARFLRAGTTERQAVLQRVFGTQLYEDVEKQLEEMRKQAKREIDAAHGALATSLARFAEAAEVDDERRALLEEHAQALRLEDLAAAVEERIVQVRTAADDAAGRASTATAAETAARESVDAARVARTRIDRRRELDALAARLAAEAPAHRAAEEALARDEAARTLAAAIARLAAARRAETTAAGALAEALEAARDPHPDLARLLEAEDPAGADAGDPDASDAALADAVEESTAAAGALNDLVALEANIPSRAEELERRRTALAEAQAALTRLAEQIAERPAQRTALVEARDAAAASAAALADARLAQQGATARLQAAQGAARQATVVEKAEASVQSAVTAARTAAETEAELRRRRYAGIAAELAGALEEQQPCPVCGSVEHPAPATPTDGAVDAEQVEAAEAARQTADARLAAAQRTHALAEQELTTLREAAGDLDVAAATATLKQADAAVLTASEAGKRASALEQRITAHDEEDRTLQARREAQALAQRGESAALAEADTALAADRERVSTARGDAGSVDERRQGHRVRARAAATLRDALRTARDAARGASERADEVLQVRESAMARLMARLAELGIATDPADAVDPADPVDPGLADDADVQAAVLADDRRSVLARRVRDRAIDESRLADGLAEEGIAEVDASEEAREAAEALLRERTESLAAAQAAAREAAGVAARTAGTLERGTAAQSALARRRAEVEGVSEQAGVVLRVADLATGRSSDGDRIPLSTFVLMKRFEDVIVAANARLALFSSSDLELRRDTAARGARKTGLDLQVLDHRTDASRVPETLSGGETFVVSLALALGLADIVTGEAGGVQLETLFIDEGFGSLDPESLDRVVGEIGQLAQHGRTIGLVSHVGELKQQISEQIHVRRQADGSSTLTVTA
ncbi:AAA family ATPase [Brachybacterium sp. DNPG3]